MQVDATSVAKNFRILANSNSSNTLNIYYYWGWHLDHHRDIGVLCPWPWTRCTFHMGMDSVANTIFVMIHFESTTRCARVALFLSPLWTLTCATSQGVRTKTTSPRFQYISIITNWRKWIKKDQNTTFCYTSLAIHQRKSFRFGCRLKTMQPGMMAREPRAAWRWNFKVFFHGEKSTTG